MFETIDTNIIIPPSDIRDVIKKTAWFVYKKGQDFEKKIRENENSNQKFSFLNPNDPYYEFYVLSKSSLDQKPESSTPNKKDDSLGLELKSFNIEDFIFEDYLSSICDCDLSLLSSLNSLFFTGIYSNLLSKHFSSQYNDILNKNYKILSFQDNFNLLSFKNIKNSNSFSKRTNSSLNTNQDWTKIHVLSYIDFHDFNIQSSKAPLMKNNLLGLNVQERKEIFKNSKMNL